MTNAEKFKTAEERKAAYQGYVDRHWNPLGEFSWLELEYEEELWRCPFCDGYALIYKSDNLDVWYASCNNCGIRTEGDTSKDLAIAAWNRRVK